MPCRSYWDEESPPEPSRKTKYVHDEDRLWTATKSESKLNEVTRLLCQACKTYNPPQDSELGRWYIKHIAEDRARLGAERKAVESQIDNLAKKIAGLSASSDTAAEEMDRLLAKNNAISKELEQL
jgi:hypothetical protein